MSRPDLLQDGLDPHPHAVGEGDDRHHRGDDRGPDRDDVGTERQHHHGQRGHEDRDGGGERHRHDDGHEDRHDGLHGRVEVAHGNLLSPLSGKVEKSTKAGRQWWTRVSGSALQGVAPCLAPFEFCQSIRLCLTDDVDEVRPRVPAKEPGGALLHVTDLIVVEVRGQDSDFIGHDKPFCPRGAWGEHSICSQFMPPRKFLGGGSFGNPPFFVKED